MCVEGGREGYKQVLAEAVFIVHYGPLMGGSIDDLIWIGMPMILAGILSCDACGSKRLLAVVSCWRSYPSTPYFVSTLIHYKCSSSRCNGII